MAYSKWILLDYLWQDWNSVDKNMHISPSTNKYIFMEKKTFISFFIVRIFKKNSNTEFKYK